MRSVEKTLALWTAGFLSSDQVTEWAGRQIAELDEPPYELIELTCYGPDHCLKQSAADFSPRPSPMTYEEGFCLRAVASNLQDDAAVASFAYWATTNCIGEDLDRPYVVLGYQLDHLLNDNQDLSGAIALVRSELPKLLPGCTQIALQYAETEA